MRFLKFLLVFIAIYGAATWILGKMQKEEWLSFVYPNRHNLMADRYGGTFSTLEECRSASLDLLEGLNAIDSGDYECALNCDTSGGKPYVCEETAR